MNIMKKIERHADAIAFGLMLTVTGCAGISQAIDDIRASGIVDEVSCQLWAEKGRGLAEDIWTHDWPVFAPIFERDLGPEQAEEYCRDVIEGLGARVIEKPEGSGRSTALGYVVLLDPDFDRRPAWRRATTMCHEAAHIVWQHRRGPIAALDYATVSGRMVAEGTAYALSDALAESWGLDVTEMARERAQRFPRNYGLERTLTGDCVEHYFVRLRSVLRERAGV